MVRWDCSKDGHRRNGRIPHGRSCLPLSTAANPHLIRVLGMASVHLEAQTMLSKSVPCQRYLAQLLTAKAESFLLQGSLWPWLFCGLSCSFCLLCFSNTAGCFFTGSQQIWTLTCLSNKQCGSYLGLTETCSENPIPVPTASSLLRILLTSSACTVGWGSGAYLLLSCMLQLQNWSCTMQCTIAYK